MFTILMFASIALFEAFDAYWTASAEVRRLDDWVAAEETQSGLLSLAFQMWLPAFVLLIIWSNQAYKAAISHNLGGMRWSSGWAVGAWFIPAANLIIPKLVLNEIERVSTYVHTNRAARTTPLSLAVQAAFAGIRSPAPAKETIERPWQKQPLSALGLVFWLALAGGILANLLAGAVYPADFDPEALRVSYFLSVLGAASLAVGCGTGALFVGKVGKRLATGPVLVLARAAVPDRGSRRRSCSVIPRRR
jgi:hypothetical protein